jgi:hypothetical protein
MFKKIGKIKIQDCFGSRPDLHIYTNLLKETNQHHIWGTGREACLLLAETGVLWIGTSEMGIASRIFNIE